MNTCKTCKWWKEPAKSNTGGLSLCTGNTGGWYEIDAPRDASVVESDWDGGGRLYTGPDFGCVRHESKE